MAARRRADQEQTGSSGGGQVTEEQHSPRKRKSKPDTGSRHMWLVNPLPEKVYATYVHPKWLLITPSSVACAAVNMGAVCMAALATQKEQATSSTFIFLVLAICSFSHRMLVYAAIDWHWYVVDYCVIMDAAIAWQLWQLSSGAIAADDERAVAQLFVMAAGIGSFVLMLSTKFAIHHPECAASWWIHVGVPLWLSLAMRHWPGFAASGQLSGTEIFGLFVRGYLPWWCGYFCLIMFKPFIPCWLAKSPCLITDYMGSAPSFRLQLKFMTGHALFAVFGGAVGSIAYNSLLLHWLWVGLTTASSVVYGLKFYRACAASGDAAEA
jgi:hypothetical protein